MAAGAQGLQGEAMDAGARRLGRTIAVAAAVIGAVLVWAVAHLGFGEDLIVSQPGRESQDVDVVTVLIFSLVPSLLGWALLAVLERFAAARARIIWTVVALVVLALSFVPLFQVEATGATKAALALMHVVVGAALVGGFWRTGK